jgi:hypothetical protein
MVPTMKSRASMGRLIGEALEFDNPEQWEDCAPTVKEVEENATMIVHVMEYCRRAQDKQPERYLLKYPLKIMEPENFDGLVVEADRALKTLDEHSRMQVSSIMDCWDDYLRETAKGAA